MIVAGPRANISLLDQTVQQKLANAIPGNMRRMSCPCTSGIDNVYTSRKNRRGKATRGGKEN